jgi:gluconolactonase
MRALVLASALLGVAMLVPGPQAAAQTTADAPAGRPAAVIDLATDEGLRLVEGQWRYRDVSVIEVAHRAVGPDLRPSGPPNRTHDIAPHAEAAGFDDSAWELLPASRLQARKGNGRLSFNWYRTAITIPDRIGTFDPTGSTVVFEIVVDDYAEVWVDGRLPIVLGQTGGALVKGFNAPNRVVLTRDARPGQRFQLAVFGMNGPVSNPPGNFIWVRSATLDFHRPGDAGRRRPVPVEIVRHHPALDAIVPPSARLEKLADGFVFTEGPVWVPRTATTEGFLLFSDPNANTIYRWSPEGQV